MFYSEFVLTRKGPLAKVWLAASYEKKLSKTHFLQTSIPSSVGAIVGEGQEPMALRLSGQLLLGVVRIYSRKARYLLEDCTEALVKIKLAFRPGVVNLPDDQAVANYNAITMADALTEFDILLPEPALNLLFAESALEGSLGASQNTSRASDITMRDSASFSLSDMGAVDIFSDIEHGLGAAGGEGLLNFDVEPDLPDLSRPLETGRPSIAVSEIEVGRDAAAELPFVPEDVTGMLPEGGIEKEPTIPTEAPEGADLFSFAAGDISELPLGEAEPAAGLSFGADAPEGLLDVSGLADVGARSLAVRGRARPSTPPPGPAPPQPPATPARKRKIVDDQTELPARQIVAQLKDTSDITVQAATLPASSHALVLSNARRNLYSIQQFRPWVPGQALSLFDLSEVPMALPPFKVPRVEVPGPTTPAGPAVETPERPRRKPADASREEDGSRHKRTPEAEGFDIPPPLDLPEEGVPVGFLADIPEPIGLEPSMEGLTSLEGPEAEVPELSISMSAASVGGSVDKGVRLFHDSEESAEGSVGSGAGFSRATLGAMRILREKLQTQESSQLAFGSLINEAPRRDRARLFFELLVLKTKDMIDVQQASPFAEIVISGKPADGALLRNRPRPSDAREPMGNSASSAGNPHGGSRRGLDAAVSADSLTVEEHRRRNQRVGAGGDEGLSRQGSRGLFKATTLGRAGSKGSQGAATVLRTREMLGDVGTDAPAPLDAAPTTPDWQSSPRRQPAAAPQTDHGLRSDRRSPSVQDSPPSTPVLLAASLPQLCAALQPSTADIEGILDDYLSLHVATAVSRVPSPSSSPPASSGKRVASATTVAADSDCATPDGLAWVHEYYQAAWAAAAEKAAAATATDKLVDTPQPPSPSLSTAAALPDVAAAPSAFKASSPHNSIIPPSSAVVAPAHEEPLPGQKAAEDAAHNHATTPLIPTGISVELLFSAASPQLSAMPEPAAGRSAAAAAGGWRPQQQAWGGSRELATAALSPATSVTAPAAVGVEGGGARALFLGRKLRATAAASAVKWAAAAAAAAGGSRPSARMSKANSCSSVFVEFSMTSADLQQVLKCVSEAVSGSAKRSIDLSTLARYEVGDEILLERLHPVSRHIRFYKRGPSPKDVLKYLECIFRAADLPGAVAVVAAVYLERMLERTGVSLHPGNWAIALLGAVILASKVWDDHAVWNVDFCQIFPDIEVAYLNELERWYLRSMDYNVSVKLSAYAQTFFEMHELRPLTDLTPATGGDSEPPPSVTEGDVRFGGDRESQGALKRARSDFLFTPASVPLQII